MKIDLLVGELKKVKKKFFFCENFFRFITVFYAGIASVFFIVMCAAILVGNVVVPSIVLFLIVAVLIGLYILTEYILEKINKKYKKIISAFYDKDIYIPFLKELHIFISKMEKDFDLLKSGLESDFKNIVFEVDEKKLSIRNMFILLDIYDLKIKIDNLCVEEVNKQSRFNEILKEFEGHEPDNVIRSELLFFSKNKIK